MTRIFSCAFLTVTSVYYYRSPLMQERYSMIERSFFELSFLVKRTQNRITLAELRRDLETNIPATFSIHPKRVSHYK